MVVTAQVEQRLATTTGQAAGETGVTTQDQSEVQDKYAIDPTLHPSNTQHGSDTLLDTLQYIAQQADVSHDFHRDMQSQTQTDKYEL